MNSSIAVIITTYNSPVYLNMVLRGYSRQSLLPDEILVADDGSGPETAEVVSNWKRTLPVPLRHVWHEDRGFRAATIRNEAVKATDAEYLVFTDGDCVPHRHFIRDHKRLMKAGWFVQGKRMLVGRDASGSFGPAGFLRMLSLCMRGELSGCHHLIRLPGLTFRKSGLRGIKTCNLALYRSDFEAVNGFDEEFTGWGREDAELVSRLFNYGVMRHDPPFGALVYHLWHPENSRGQLSDNDNRLQESIDSCATSCRNGLRKDVS